MTMCTSSTEKVRSHLHIGIRENAVMYVEPAQPKAVEFLQSDKYALQLQFSSLPGIELRKDARSGHHGKCGAPGSQ